VGHEARDGFAFSREFVLSQAGTSFLGLATQVKGVGAE